MDAYRLLLRAESAGYGTIGAFAAALIGVLVWACLSVPWPVLFATIVQGWLLAILSIIDARTMTLPRELNVFLGALGALFIWQFDPGLLPLHLVAAVAGWTALALVGWSYRRLRHRDGLGIGDAWLFGAGAIWVGPAGLPSVLAIAAFSGLIVMIAWSWRLGERIDGASAVPFGPFLALGIWLTWIHGPVL
ncbi:MAG: prepilin peptidase [Geminicoccaceae bacterium]